MTAFFRASNARLLVAAATIGSASLPISQAVAQNPPAAPAAQTPACQIDDSKPQAVARATFSLTRAQARSKTPDAMRDLRDVIAGLEAPIPENQLARAAILAQAYNLLLDQPGVTPVVSRGSVGFKTNPAATVDLFAAIDSALVVVEQASPGCKEVALQIRRQAPWLNVTNAAINALNAKQLDSAQYYAERSLILDKTTPYPYWVLASVAKARKDPVRLHEFALRTIELAGNDTAYATLREQALFEVASNAAQRAESASPAQRQALARDARTAWNQFLVVSRDEARTAGAVQSLAKMYVLAGDSAALPRLFTEIANNAGKFTEMALLNAGVLASQHKRHAEAARLFSAVLARNPYQRDALNNLAASYIFLNDYTKVFPLVKKLLEVDPSNPDNWMLYTYTYSGLVKNAKGPQAKLYGDSLLFYNAKAEKMPVKVLVNEFTRLTDATTLAGRIENRGTTTKSYTLTVEFLDRTGAVVATEVANVGPVAPKASAQFRVRAPKGGAVAYRYKPIV